MKSEDSQVGVVLQLIPEFTGPSILKNKDTAAAILHNKAYVSLRMGKYSGSRKISIFEVFSEFSITLSVSDMRGNFAPD